MGQKQRYLLSLALCNQSLLAYCKNTVDIFQPFIFNHKLGKVFLPISISCLFQIKVLLLNCFFRFNISLDFRTYDRDGMMFYLTSADQSVFIAVQIFQSQLQLVYTPNEGSQAYEVTSNIKVNDGKWHNVRKCQY